MKVFKNVGKAFESMQSKKPIYINSQCPYNENSLCGNWCALFYYSSEVENEYKKVSAYVILGCKVDQKRLYIDEIVEE